MKWLIVFVILLAGCASEPASVQSETSTGDDTPILNETMAPAPVQNQTQESSGNNTESGPMEPVPPVEPVVIEPVNESEPNPRGDLFYNATGIKFTPNEVRFAWIQMNDTFSVQSIVTEGEDFNGFLVLHKTSLFLPTTCSPKSSETLVFHANGPQESLVDIPAGQYDVYLYHEGNDDVTFLFTSPDDYEFDAAQANVTAGAFSEFTSTFSAEGSTGSYTASETATHAIGPGVFSFEATTSGFAVDTQTSIEVHASDACLTQEGDSYVFSGGSTERVIGVHNEVASLDFITNWSATATDGTDVSTFIWALEFAEFGN